MGLQIGAFSLLLFSHIHSSKFATFQAATPTEKSFRPSHRASVHGSILHDASYLATIEIKGPEDLLCTILGSCCDCQGPSPSAKRHVVFNVSSRTRSLTVGQVFDGRAYGRDVSIWIQQIPLQSHRTRHRALACGPFACSFGPAFSNLSWKAGEREREAKGCP